ncbi:hypothetical protein [Aquabacter spiritensis]|uniref:Uncharacterized protein n=1 Tax=Aquabacter spiritensis TaxID=933073 RepID=A0A4R3M5P3_9HYPH|nr:hypothetical protein [Aquabacter spiritensis]TCT08246.1 hypothetical protein EDC64_101768 [Aquabacter spiritensis]
MKTIITAGTSLVALALASVALPGLAAADDSVTQVNDSVIRTQQMDYYLRNGGYVIYQDQYSAAVGGRNSTIVQPAPRVYVPAQPYTSTYVVTPGPSYMMR